MIVILSPSVNTSFALAYLARSSSAISTATGFDQGQTRRAQHPPASVKSFGTDAGHYKTCPRRSEPRSLRGYIETARIKALSKTAGSNPPRYPTSVQD